MRLMLLTLLTFLLSPAFAQPGTLDPTFGHNGAMALTLGDMLIIPTSVATNNEGEIFIGGNHPDFDYGGTSILLVKLLEDGSLDLNFAEAGIYHVKDEDAPWHENTLNAVAVQADGKILISGTTESPGVRMHYVTRLLPNGSHDNTFGTNGTILRQYPTGNGSDLYSTFVRSVRVLPDSKILTVAYGFDQQGENIFYDAILCARFLSNGQPDPDFGDGGYKILAYNNIFWLYPNMLVNNDTSIILFINGAGYFSLLSIDEDGEPVGGFGTDGIASLPQYSMEMVFFNTPAIHLPDGKIVVGFRWYIDDYTTKYYVVQLLSDGSPDVAFNGTGMLEIVTNSNESFIGKSIQFLQDENAIIITGTLYDIDENMIPTGSRLRTYRILNNGSIDESYGDSGYKEEDLGFWVATLEAGAVLPDGKVVLAGYTIQGQLFNLTPRLLVVRLNIDGEPEGLLADRLTTTGSEIMQLHIGEHGKILMVGNNTAGPRKELLLRQLTPEGSFDPDFIANVGPYTPVMGFDLQAFDMAVTDDAIVAAGYINTEDEGINNLLVARFTPDGLLETDFGVMGSVSTEDKGINARALSIAIQDDGKILAGGAKDNKPYLARFNTNGSWDNSFGINGELFTDDAGIIHDLLITPGQEILAAAYNPVAGGNRDFILYKITPAGVLDAGFGIGGKLKVDMGTNNDLSQHIARYTNGSLLISGAVGAGTGFVKLLPNGNIDTGFGNNGRTYLAARSGNRHWRYDFTGKWQHISRTHGQSG
jgi:uncharacterized delta-60 repeat protein